MFKCRFEEKQHVRGSNQANNLLPCGPYLKKIFTLEHVCSNGFQKEIILPDAFNVDPGLINRLRCDGRSSVIAMSMDPPS